MAERCDLVATVPRPALGPREARLRRLAGLARARPSWVAEWAVPECHARVATMVEAWRPDLVHVHYQVMGQYLAALRGLRAPRVLVVYEPATSRAAAAAAEAPLGPRRLRLSQCEYLPEDLERLVVFFIIAVNRA